MSEVPTQTKATSGEALARTLKPRSVAIVGLSDNSGFKDFISPTLDSEAEIHFVNPRYESVMGRPTVPTLSAVEGPLDVVMSFMSAERTTDLVEEAAGLGVGGMVLVAGGFGETSEEGAVLQQRIATAAQGAGMAVVGPNGLGYVNVPHGISLTIASKHKRRPGGISVISQSGAMLSGIAMAAWEYAGCGLNVLVSAGNEAVTDLADYVDYLTDDPETTGIALVIEKVRRPDEFFAAARRAVEAGKPVVALKLARNARSQKMAASHTGALTGDAWVYDVAFRQAGIALAYDPEEVVDRLALFDQIPRRRWTSVSNLGVVTMTGGFASLSLDIATEEGVEIPALDSFEEWIQTNLPGITVPNPLDTTGLGASLWPEIINKYAVSNEVDALLVVHPVADEDAAISESIVVEFAKAASSVEKPCVLANCSGVPGGFAASLIGEDVAFGRGLRPTLRGLQTLGAFSRYQAAQVAPLPAVAPLPRPTGAPVPQPEGDMLPFADTMRLLQENGIPVAPYAMVAPDDDPAAVDIGFAGPYVVKLADVAHRTEHDAVLLGIDQAGLAGAVATLRGIAAADGLASVVAVQPMIKATGEALLGIQGESELGPLVAFGLGGIFVEALGRIGGRMAPFSEDEARALIDEFQDVKVMHGFRGKPAWDHDALAALLVATGRLA
ncbi:MAG: CoA-binding protein, partial [Frankiales bacterium]|nr:CoA-binding protein [Frankiales bacterium]